MHVLLRNKRTASVTGDKRNLGDYNNGKSSLEKCEKTLWGVGSCAFGSLFC